MAQAKAIGRKPVADVPRPEETMEFAKSPKLCRPGRLLLDTSGPIQGDPIAALNEGRFGKSCYLGMISLALLLVGLWRCDSQKEPRPPTAPARASTSLVALAAGAQITTLSPEGLSQLEDWLKSSEQTVIDPGSLSRDKVYRVTFADASRILLVAARRNENMNDPSGDYGLRFFVLAPDAKGFKIANFSRGVSDTYALKPKLLTCGERVYVLGEEASEYVYGFGVYKLDKDGIKDLAMVNAAPADDRVDLFDAVTAECQPDLDNVETLPRFTFSQSIEIHPGSDTEGIIELKQGEKVEFNYQPGESTPFTYNPMGRYKFKVLRK